MSISLNTQLEYLLEYSTYVDQADKSYGYHFFSIGKIGKCRNNRINQADDQAQVKFIFSLEIFISRTLKRWAGTADHIQMKWSFIQYKISSANMHTKHTTGIIFLLL